MLKILEHDEISDDVRTTWFRGRPVMLGLVVIAVLAAAGYWLWSGALPKRYETVRPEVGTAVLAVYGTGQVEPVTWAKLSTASSARLMQLNVREGDRVKKGDVLAVQDDLVERATLDELEARQRFYEEDLARKEKLADRSIVARADVGQIRALAEEFAAKVQAQKERIAHLRIVSPIDGIVLRRDGELGELLSAGTTVLWVGDPAEMQVVATIDEEDIVLARVGQAVLVKSDAFPDRIIRGTLKQITLKGDPVAKTFRVRVALPADSGLLVGMTTEINIVAREVADALLVPATSVIDGHVFRMVNGRPVRTPVEVGIRSGQRLQILSGLDGSADIVSDARAVVSGGS